MGVILIAVISATLIAIVYNLLKEIKFTKSLKKFKTTQGLLDKLANVDWDNINITLKPERRSTLLTVNKEIYIYNEKIFNNYNKNIKWSNILTTNNEIFNNRNLIYSIKFDSNKYVLHKKYSILKSFSQTKSKNPFLARSKDPLLSYDSNQYSYKNNQKELCFSF